MTNIFGTPEKGPLRDKLFQIGVEALRKHGWKVERIPGIGKASVRRITKEGRSRKVSIRTSQDTWIAFPRDRQNNGWKTLSDLDVVLAVSVDDRDDPKFAQVHMIEADEMRERFNRAYAARMAAGHTIPLERGIWISLYHPEANHPVNRVGAGAGLAHPPIERVALDAKKLDSTVAAEGAKQADIEPLSIAEAKRRLAMSLGVDPSSIKITVEA